MKQLTDVTLVVVSAEDVKAAVTALDYSQRELKFGEILLVSDRNSLRDDALYRFVPINPVSSVGDWAKYVVFDLHKQIKTKFTLITIFTNWLSCYAAYCIPLTAQREDTCSATGRVRRAHPTTALAT